MGLDVWLGIVYGVVSLAIAGTGYELLTAGGKKQFDDADGGPLIGITIFWPLAAAFGILAGVIYCAMWIPRLPARLIIKTIEKREQAQLPEARVV